MLKDTVGAIERTIKVYVEDKIITSKVARSAGTGFDELSSLAGDQKIFLSLPYNIL